MNIKKDQSSLVGVKCKRWIQVHLWRKICFVLQAQEQIKVVPMIFFFFPSLSLNWTISYLVAVWHLKFKKSPDKTNTFWLVLFQYTLFRLKNHHTLHSKQKPFAHKFKLYYKLQKWPYEPFLVSVFPFPQIFNKRTMD